MATYNEETKIWSNPSSVSLYNPRTNLGQVLVAALQLNEGKTFQIEASNGAKISTTEARTRAIRAAQNLQKQGIEEGDILAIAARTLENVPSILFAGLLLGAPVNTLDPDFNIGKNFTLPMKFKNNFFVVLI